jgi:hypothetical protein
MEEVDNESHAVRRELFVRGVRRGFLTVQEIEEALPPGCLSPSERWLLYYSLRAANVEVRGLRLLPGGTARSPAEEGSGPTTGSE